ncbi:MAG: class I SAM-dependent methyltransferase [Nitrospirae bacterium]|nr:class I SAM-dependent methyltransferase [Nitrospirota bacterium]
MEIEQSSWDELYDIDPEHFGAGESKFAITCCQIMKDYGVKRILDIGCGYGRDSIFFGRQGFNVFALDYSHKALSILNRRISASPLKKNVVPIQYDICKGMPFDDGYFDAVYSFLLFPVGFSETEIEYIFSEIYRVLQHNGLFLACVRTGKEVSSFFDERYIRSKLKMFHINTLNARNISVGRYNFNVIEIFSRRTA